MKFEKRFLVIADSVIIDKNEKVSIIGIYDTIFSHTFPAIHPKFMLVGSVTVLDRSIKSIDFGIKLLDSDKNPVIDKEIPKVVANLPDKNEANENAPRIANLIYEISNIKFEKSGIYSFIVSADGEEIGTTEFSVLKMSK